MNPLIGRTAIRASAAALISVAASTAMAQTGAAPNYGCPLGAAHATTCINGGGSSLASNVYTETTPAQGIFTMVASKTGGTLGISYEKASSGAGQSAFETNDPFNFNGTDAHNAFAVHYGASDAFIDSASVLFPFVGEGHSLPGSGGPFIQVPMFATPIAIPVNNTKVTKNGSGSTTVAGSVTLTDNDLCGIFSGLITNWGATSAKTHLTKGTIHVFWRNDNKGSGTTFLLTQHLAAVCNSSNTLSGFTFVATTKFATLFNGVHGVTITTPPNDGSTVWTIPTAGDGSFANLVGGKGSNGIADGVLTDATHSAIGYVSPDFTSIAPTPAASDIGTPYTSLLVADVKNASDGKHYAPDAASLLLAMKNPGPTAVNPTPPALTQANKANAANQTKWVPQIANPAHGYPIMGYTNLLVAQCYKKGAVANGVKSMLKTDFSPAAKTLLVNNGFEPTLGAGSSGFGKAALDAFVSNVGGLNLNIGNATVCGGFTGR